MFLNAIPAIGRRHRCLYYVVVASESSSSWHWSWPATTRLLRKSSASPSPFATAAVLCIIRCHLVVFQILRSHDGYEDIPRVDTTPSIRYRQWGHHIRRFFGYGPAGHGLTTDDWPSYYMNQYLNYVVFISTGDKLLIYIVDFVLSFICQLLLWHI